MFTGWRWPLPNGEMPGDWVCADGEIGLCVNGIHAADQLPQWLGDEIWEIELDGEIVHTEPALVAARGRLVRRLTEWDEAARLAFCENYAGRARCLADRNPARAELYTGKIEPFTTRAMSAAVGYWTALLAGDAAVGRRDGPEYDGAFARERAAQAA